MLRDLQFGSGTIARGSPKIRVPLIVRISADAGVWRPDPEVTGTSAAHSEIWVPLIVRISGEFKG
jgi:hypothetical protein